MTLICLLGPWYGYGMVFPALALMTLLLVLRPEKGDRRESVVTAVCGLAALLVSIGGVWHLAAATQAHHPALVKFTASWFIDPLRMNSWFRAGAYGALSTAVTMFPVDALVTQIRGWEKVLVAAMVATVVWLVALIGLYGWAGRGRRAMACWVLLPWVLLLAAAIAHVYPFAQTRMMVAVAAPLVLTLAVGISRIARECSIVFVGSGRPGLVAGLILTCVPAVYMIHVPMQPDHSTYQDFPTVLDVLRRERQTDESVAVTLLAVPCVRYYADEQYGPMIYMPNTAGTLPLPEFDYKTWVDETVQHAGPRWWILTTKNPGGQHKTQLLQTAREHGYRIEVKAEAGVRSSNGPAQLLFLTSETH